MDELNAQQHKEIAKLHKDEIDVVEVEGEIVVEVIFGVNSKINRF